MPIGPGLDPAISGPLMDHDERLGQLEQPGQPLRFYVDRTATTAATLVSAARFPDCVIWLRALSTFVVSDGENWIRQDTQGAL